MSWSIQEQRAVIAEIMERAMIDPAFNARALADPGWAVLEASGKPLPEGFKLRFVPNEKADLTIVLPDLQADAAELSDVELEQVAGGRCGASCASTCAVSLTVGLGIPGVGGIACG